jgi:ABC-2 type transport system permease protein
MVATLDILRRLIGVQFRSQLQYRVSFLMDVLTTALVTVAEFGSLALVFQRFESIAGWTLGEVAFLYGLVEAAFGMMDMIFSGFDPQTFGDLVRRGGFDQLLLRPLPITLQVFGSRFILRRLGRVLQGLLIFGLALWLTEVAWTPAKLLYLPLVFASLVCFFGGLFVIGATITFWTVESLEAINIFTYGSSYMIAFPMHIYQDWLRRFYTFVIPAIFLNYYPTLYFLDKPDPFQMPALAPFLAPLVGFGMLGVALAGWRYGIRYYQGTGS